ncbi:HEAT repeat domain-containing protein [Streptomyces sp. NPDC056004]|uniref:HEAT repeat domain-containing protein n=1 Tax=unclassified Streptomyces TaxID=2593676 RepID=UPI0035D6FBE8
MPRRPDELDEVDWAAYEHAYGPADDLPGLLRDLASDDARVRGEAVDELFGTVWHQHSVYGATVVAVPFLAHFARTAPGHRSVLLGLLSQIAQGNGRSAPAARRAVLEELPALLALAHDPGPDPAAVRSLLRLIAAFGDLALPAMPLLRGLHESAPDPAVRADALTAMGYVDDAAPAQRARCRAGLRDLAPELRLAAAHSLLRTGQPPYAPWLVEAAAEVVAVQTEGFEGPLWPGRTIRLEDRVRQLLDGSHEERRSL